MEPKELKRYPYFTAWLEEIDRPLEDVEGIGVEQEMKETEPAAMWKTFVPTDDFTATLTLKSGEVLERHGKFSDGTMTYLEAKESADEQQTQEATEA